MQMILPVRLETPEPTEAQREIRGFMEQAEAVRRGRRNAFLLAPFTGLIGLAQKKRARLSAPSDNVACRAAYDPQM